MGSNSSLSFSLNPPYSLSAPSCAAATSGATAKSAAAIQQSTGGGVKAIAVARRSSEPASQANLLGLSVARINKQFDGAQLSRPGPSRINSSSSLSIPCVVARSRLSFRIQRNSSEFANNPLQVRSKKKRRAASPWSWRDRSL
jgi:hypothetical protein